jgi:membrane protein required for colicin V production
MAIVDWVILIVLILSVVSAAKAGLILEVFSLAGLVLGLLVASWDYQKLTPWMRHCRLSWWHLE